MLCLPSVAVSSGSGVKQRSGHGDGGVAGLGGDDGLAGRHGKLVLDGRTGDLGDGVAVLDLDGDLDNLGAVNTVLGGDLTAGVLHSLGDGVGNSVGNGQRSHGVGHSNRGGSKGSMGVGGSSQY